MSKEFKLPELGENIDSADILNVLVSVGDKIELEQSVIEIETDKATIEVPATVSGVVKELSVKPGDNIKVGQTILIVEETGEQESGSVKKGIKKSKRVETKIEEEPVRKKEHEIDPSKGEIEKSRIGEFDDHQPPITRGSAPAAPSVRKLARELGVEIKKVPGTGSAGRISLDDVKVYVKNLNENMPASVVSGIPQEKLPDFTKYGKVENVPMSKIRKVTATHLGYAWSTIPHVTQFDKADITVLEKARKAFNPKVEEARSEERRVGKECRSRWSPYH